MAKRDPSDPKSYPYQVHAGTKADKSGSPAGRIEKEGHPSLDAAIAAAKEHAAEGKTAEVRSTGGAMMTFGPKAAAQTSMAKSSAAAASGDHKAAEEHRQAAQGAAAAAIDNKAGDDERKRDDHGRFA